MAKVYLSVKIEVKEEEKETFFENLKVLHELTHKEDRGCLQYELFENREAKNTYHLLETWEDEASLEEHKEKEHYLKFLSENENKILNVQVDILNKL